MGIYISGMEMPESCGKCLDIGWNYVFECNLDDVENGEQKLDCPLVPVPAHGRLIDADALTKQIKRDGIASDPFVKIVCNYFKDAPTIIPASEE